MVAPTAPTEKKPAPPRNELKNARGLYKKSQTLRGQDPRYIYKYFNTDNPRHPSYIGKRDVPHEVGNARTGYAMAPGWTPVNKLTDPDMFPEHNSEAAGRGVDSATAFGGSARVLCKMLREDHEATYQLAETSYQEEIEKSFYAPEKTRFGGDGVQGTASVAAVLSNDLEGGEQALDTVRGMVGRRQ